MSNEREFSWAEIHTALAELEIANDVVLSSPEAARNKYRFSSLRAPRPGSLMYSVDGDVADLGLVDCAILAMNPIPLTGISTIVVSDPQITFYRLMNRFFSDDIDRSPATHATALIHQEAVIDPDAHIGPFCVIGRASIAAGVVLHSHVVIHDNVFVGAETVVESHTTLGATGVVWVNDPQTGAKIRQPQIGGVHIGASCFLGTGVTVVRGSVNEVTTIGKSVVIAHGTRIGHGCNIESGVHMANNVALAGNVSIGSESFLGSGCSLRSGVTLASGTVVGCGAAVVSDCGDEGQVLAGVPAVVLSARGAGKLSGVPQ